ncbi:serine carboxypeptidase-like 18 isoform X2 [Macadamia integrifolia]|uniref:serine carboxypeptidase-like 18 isoform X2 n=1 Tax=Macadamia integrifolia TaxID=60698 RepID=UPI001C4F6B0E|nr:serine carboxypeptidase-like 18 isoform X2 [Macadamia integrifolia]
MGGGAGYKQLWLYFNFMLLVQLQLWSSLLPISYSAAVRHLPGFGAPLPFELETGYVGVGESEDVQLFYYFIKSEKNPEKDPLVVWLTGGPGCSSLSGLLYEIGPLSFVVKEYDGTLPNLVLKPHSWTQVASIIFIDSPVGTGFSYSTTSQGLLTGDLKSSKHLYQFFTKWMIDHPEFLNNPFYVAGDSYSGMIVPLVTKEISDGNEAGNEPFINIKGYLIGNPVTDVVFDSNKQVQYAHGMGLIPDELYESVKRSCGGNYVQIDPTNVQCWKDMLSYYKCISGLNTAQILEPLCSFFASPTPEEMVGERRSLWQNYKEFLDPIPPTPEVGCRSYGYHLASLWVNDNRVRNALHIRKGSVEKWQRCSYLLGYSSEIQSTIEYHANLSKKGYRSLIYSGDHDMIVPFLATEAWIKSLNYYIVDEWRSWLVDGQIGGYTRTYSNRMTFATVKGGGHTTPEYKPKECFAMFERWIFEEPL